MAAAKEVAVQGHVALSRGGWKKNGCEEGLCWESGHQFGGASWQQRSLPDCVDESHAGQPAVPSVAAVRVFLATLTAA